MVKYPLSFPIDDKNVYFSYDYSDGTSDVINYLSRTTSSLRGSFYRLYNGSTVVPKDSIVVDEFQTMEGLKIMKLSSKLTVTNIEFEVSSATTSTYTRWLKIYSAFTVNGSYSVEDCGTSIVGTFVPKINAVPLGGPALSNTIQDVFNGDPNTYVTDYIVGVLTIGAPEWHHKVQFLGLSTGTNTVKAKIGKTGQSVALSGVRYQFEFYRHGKLVDTSKRVTLQVLGLIGINDYSTLEIEASSNQPWDMVNLVIDQPGNKCFRMYITYI